MTAASKHRRYVAGMTAAQLTAAGYRRVSNSYRCVARIDRPDWKDVLAKYLCTTPDKLSGNGHEDSYRRIFAEDAIYDVPQHIYRKIPASKG